MGRSYLLFWARYPKATEHGLPQMLQGVPHNEEPTKIIHDIDSIKKNLEKQT